MIAVGVRDLKNQLSQYLQYVKHGEKVFITEHNRVIAEISLPKEELSNTDIEIELEKRDIVNLCGRENETISRLGCRVINLLSVNEFLSRHNERDQLEAV